MQFALCWSSIPGHVAVTAPAKGIRFPGRRAARRHEDLTARIHQRDRTMRLPCDVGGEVLRSLVRGGSQDHQIAAIRRTDDRLHDVPVLQPGSDDRASGHLLECTTNDVALSVACTPTRRAEVAGDFVDQRTAVRRPDCHDLDSHVVHDRMAQCPDQGLEAGRRSVDGDQAAASLLRAFTFLELSRGWHEARGIYGIALVHGLIMRCRRRVRHGPKVPRGRADRHLW